VHLIEQAYAAFVLSVLAACLASGCMCSEILSVVTCWRCQAAFSKSRRVWWAILTSTVVQAMQVYSPSRLPTASRNTVAQLVEVSRTTIQVRRHRKEAFECCQQHVKAAERCQAEHHAGQVTD
jgi:phytoene dehydrogenase-like protein